jgi:hypothetical protein
MEIRDFKPALLIYHPWRPICSETKTDGYNPMLQLKKSYFEKKRLGVPQW